MEWLTSLQSACHVSGDFEKTGYADSIVLDGAWIKAAARRILKHGYFIEDITCLDFEEGLVLLYHFDHYDNPGRLTVRVVLGRGNYELPSIADIYQGAEWHERECMDFFPVVFLGNPNPSRLLLPAEMEEKPLEKTEKERIPFMDMFTFTDLGECSDDNPWAQALKDKDEALKEAAAKAEAEAAEAAAAAEAEAAAAAAEKAEGEAQEPA